MTASTAAISDFPQALPGKIGDAARQFEGLMLGQMLKSAREAASDDDGDDSESQTMFDVADQQFAQVMANNGGIGLAQLAVQGLNPKTGNQGESNADRQ
ncbi:MAG TPA: rod-binding protein [Bryobacteraceae bacterium]|nr:rod-binding protein [Bryobacteraceae bacterium]